MPLEIIPAIDLRAGRAVWLHCGDSGTEVRVAEDPIKLAERFASEGANWLHIFDLDAERTSDPQNLAVIREIIKRVRCLRIQVGGGIRTSERVGQILNIGAARVLLGTTAASTNEVAIGDLLTRYGERIVVGVEAREGYTIVQHGIPVAPERVEDFGRRLARLGAQRFLYADVSEDDTLDARKAMAVAAFARMVGRPTLASCCVSNPNDIKFLTTLQPKGIEGVILERAIYSGAVTVFDAVQIASIGAARLRASAPPPPESTGPLPEWLREIKES